jgi:hypothetical protein
MKALFEKILYPVTPTLSVDGDHERSISESETATAERPDGTEGTIVSILDDEVEDEVEVADTGAAG